MLLGARTGAGVRRCARPGVGVQEGVRAHRGREKGGEEWAAGPLRAGFGATEVHLLRSRCWGVPTI